MARHIFRCPLRWSDMDIYGIVNNVAFLRYLEEARVDLISRMAPTTHDAFFRDGSVVVSHEIRYKRQLVHRIEPVEIEMWVAELQSASVTIGYEVRDGDRVHATASTVMAPFDYAARRPRRLTPDELAFFGKYQEDGE
jgi:acyl-CoA thioester hydrolase